MSDVSLLSQVAQGSYKDAINKIAKNVDDVNELLDGSGEEPLFKLGERQNINNKLMPNQYALTTLSNEFSSDYYPLLAFTLIPPVNNYLTVIIKGYQHIDGKLQIMVVGTEYCDTDVGSTTTVIVQVLYCKKSLLGL